MVLKKAAAALLAAVMVFMAASTPGAIVSAKDTKGSGVQRTASQQYVRNMGNGWNLGNSFDGFDTNNSNLGGGETAWGNPVVTKKLLKKVKADGFQSIRIPLTIVTRYTEKDGTYVIDKEWLARYKEVVDWAQELGLYVVVNMHHDSWSWLSAWNGDKTAKEYIMYTQFYEQLANYLKEEGPKVSFETINEPNFSDTGNITAYDKLNMINEAAYKIIRSSGGNNKERMIILPTLNTNHKAENSQPLYDFITSLKDPNIIATVHYYSEWVFSANLGKTGFDEVLWDKDYTPRVAADQLFQTVNQIFSDKGIGVVIGEYGLLGYDKNPPVNQEGEELKYYEYMNYLAGKSGICLMFWDNGSGIDRQTNQWKNQKVGDMLKVCNEGKRSAYAAGLDTLYFNSITGNVSIPLTLNGNTFKGIKGLKMGKDYTYNKKTKTIVLKKDYMQKAYNKQKNGEYGTFAELVIQFSSGASWHEYLVKYTVPVFEKAAGTTAEGIKIPVSYKGSAVRRATAYLGENRVGPNSSWWAYLEKGSSFKVDYEQKNFEVTPDFFKDASVTDGTIKFIIEFYDGQTAIYMLEKQGNTVTGYEGQHSQGE